MDNTLEATLVGGEKLPYVVKANPPRGGMKYTYFAPDKSYVVQFFNDPSIANDINLQKRIMAIIGKYNPTKSATCGGAKGNDENSAKYFSQCFCWPRAIVIAPEFGIVCPTYPKEFFFKDSDSLQLTIGGKDKKSNWFTSKNRKYLSKNVVGDFRTMLRTSIILSRAIRRMHQAGLAHSDLSNNNVLIDPETGSCVVIDIDSLVVPGLFPPEVVGTRGYIAPEVLATMELDKHDPARKLPCSHTDLHALAVLIYEYLFFRHPLIGPKIYSTTSAEEDDLLALGARATFIENPHDKSNRPNNLKVTIKDLGPILEKLFIRAFVNGLHSPNDRPSAMEWERGLVETWDLLEPCHNPNCEQNFFVLHNINNPVCPFCGTKTSGKEIVRLKLKSAARGKTGQWISKSELNVYDGLPLLKWHIYSGIFPDEKADREVQAYVQKCHDSWLIINKSILGMQSPGGNLVPINQAIKLQDGDVFLASRDNKGMLIEVVIKKI